MISDGRPQCVAGSPCCNEMNGVKAPKAQRLQRAWRCRAAVRVSMTVSKALRRFRASAMA